jgi:undecaprenyl-diphosphatase
MTIWEAIILGLIQGLTEFLPVSSSGHLVFFQNVFKIYDGALSFDIAVHFATLLAVSAVLFEKIKALLKKPFTKLTFNIIISALPAVIIAFVFQSFLKSSFGGEYLGWGFLVSAVFLLIGDMVCKPTQKRLINSDLNSISTRQALIMGVFQGIAVFPGVSRSGST